MAINTLDLLIDIQTRRLIRDVFTDAPQVPPTLAQGDTYNVRVMGVRRRTSGQNRRIFDYVPLPSTLFVHLGPVGEKPELGSFTASYDGSTPVTIAYNATAAQVQTALNGITEVTSAGGLSVTGPQGGPWQIVWTNVNTPSGEWIMDGAGLYPLSSVLVYVARESSASVRLVELIAIDRQSAALASTFTDLPTVSGDVTQIQAGDTDVAEIQRITISEDAYDGTFSLTIGSVTTGAIPIDIDDIGLAEIVSGIVTGATVTGSFPSWDVSFPGAQSLMSIDVSGVLVPIGKQGELTLATAGIEQLVGGGEAVVTKLEIAGVVDGNHATIYQDDVTIINDGIQNTPEVGPTLPAFQILSEKGENNGYAPLDGGGLVPSIHLPPTPFPRIIAAGSYNVLEADEGSTLTIDATGALASDLVFVTLYATSTPKYYMVTNVTTDEFTLEASSGGFVEGENIFWQVVRPS